MKASMKITVRDERSKPVEAEGNNFVPIKGMSDEEIRGYILAGHKLCINGVPNVKTDGVPLNIGITVYDDKVEIDL